MLKVIQGH